MSSWQRFSHEVYLLNDAVEWLTWSLDTRYCPLLCSSTPRVTQKQIPHLLTTSSTHAHSLCHTKQCLFLQTNSSPREGRKVSTYISLFLLYLYVWGWLGRKFKNICLGLKDRRFWTPIKNSYEMNENWMKRVWKRTHIQDKNATEGTKLLDFLSVMNMVCPLKAWRFFFAWYNNFTMTTLTSCTHSFYSCPPYHPQSIHCSPPHICSKMGITRSNKNIYISWYYA